MRSRTLLITLILTASAFVLPHFAHAGVPFFGPIIPQPVTSGIPFSNVCPASWGMVIVVVNNIISLLLTLAIVFVAPIMIAYAGFLYVVNPVNAGGMSKAKSILLNTIVGIVIALAGYLIVAAIMAVLYDKTSPVPGTTTTLGVWSSLVTSGGVAPCLPQAGALPTGTLNQATPVSVTVVPPTTSPTSDASIRQQLTQAGITINHAACLPLSNGQGCTDVGGMQSFTVAQVIAIKNACGSSCAVQVTGGTEPGHAAGAFSHGNGYKVDLSLSSTALNTFLQRLRLTGQRGGDSGGPIRSDACGNLYVQESDHWDISVFQTCNLSLPV